MTTSTQRSGALAVPATGAPLPLAGDAVPATVRGLILLVALVALLFGLTARWNLPYNVDAYTNVLQAHSFARDGSPVIDDADHLLADKYRGELVWLVASQQGPASQYPPGVGLWAAPFYLFDTSTQQMDATFDNAGRPEPVRLNVPSLAPAALAALTSAALAMLFLGLTLRPLLPAHALYGTVVVAALGTGTWSIAANMLWQHGPAMMAISAGTWAASRGRFAHSGVAFAIALVIRPHTAVIAGSIGLVCALRRRSVRPAIAVGAPPLAALGGLVAYNNWLWGEPSISGGYGAVFASRVSDPSSLPAWFGRMVASVLDPHVGFAATSPILVLALVAAVVHRRAAPDWALGAALGGFVYLLIQYKANRVSGGTGFFGYRYPLEGLMAAAPMMALGLQRWIGADRFRLRIFAALAIASIAMHGFGAITT